VAYDQIMTKIQRLKSRSSTTGDPYCGNEDPRTAGNGSLMRLAPVPLFYARDPKQAIQRAKESSRTTHAAPTAMDACRYVAGIIVGAIGGREKEEILSAMYRPVSGPWESGELHPAVEGVTRGSFKEKSPPEIKGTGYVVDCLEAALWAFHQTETFKDGALAAVNLGDDADTTGAVYGQIAGAYYGVEEIPQTWRAKVTMMDLIERYAAELYEGRF
jgi:ADP-ribosyl-[dinitrogen reductase] hydrolase